MNEFYTTETQALPYLEPPRNLRALMFDVATEYERKPQRLEYIIGSFVDAKNIVDGSIYEAIVDVYARLLETLYARAMEASIAAASAGGRASPDWVAQFPTLATKLSSNTKS